MVMAEKKATRKKSASRRKSPARKKAAATEEGQKKAGEPKAAEKPEANPPEKKAPEAPKAAEKPAEKPEAKPAEAPAPEAKPKGRKAKKPKKGKKGPKTEHARGKRKEAIARATVKEGKGNVRVNAIMLKGFGNKYVRGIIEEPVLIAGPDALKVDIEVRVRGGGAMGQAQACRTAIARALAQWFGEGLQKKYKESDRYLLREDSRRVEPKKYKGPKARARFQKSYR